MGVIFSIFEASFPDGHRLLKFFLTVTLRVCWVHWYFSWFWFKATCLSPCWRSLNLWRGHLAISKKVTLNHLADDVLFQQFCFDTNDKKLSLIHQSNGLRGFVLRHGFLVWDHGRGISRLYRPWIKCMDTKNGGHIFEAGDFQKNSYEFQDRFVFGVSIRETSGGRS